MKTAIVSMGLSRGKDLESIQKNPKFRKATRNMMLAWTSLQEAIQPVAEKLHRASDLAVILGSGFGELEVTKDFLKGLAENGAARPLLFQNSLHNSTLGFLATQLEITGPCITVSNRCFTGENCLEWAKNLLETEQCRFCLVTTVDTQVAALEESLNQIYGEPLALGEGAATLLLASSEGLRVLERPALAWLEEIEYEAANGIEPEKKASLAGHYESDAIEKWIDAARSRRVSDSEVETLTLEKPDGTRSRIFWTKGGE